MALVGFSWNDEKPGNYLKNELGVTLREKQDINNIMAIKTPEEFIKHRTANINELFAENGKVTKFFENRRNELIKLGLPQELAKEMAMRQAKALYEQEVEILELAHPDGYAKAFGIAGIQHNATRAVESVALDERAIIRQYKDKRRTKKANRKASRAHAK